MRFRQRLFWLITCRWLVEWWIGPRAVALINVTEKHNKAEAALTAVHTKQEEIEGKITTLEGEIAKADKPNRTKLCELRTHQATLDKLRKREKVLTGRRDELSEILSRFELDDDYMPLSEHDQKVVRSVSDRVMKQGDEAQVDANAIADSSASIADAIDCSSLDDELAKMHREIKDRYAPKSVEPPKELAKIVQFPAKAAEPAKEPPAPDIKDALKAGTGFDVLPDDEDDDEDDPPQRQAELA